jgi:hypothetical protein
MRRGDQMVKFEPDGRCGREIKPTDYRYKDYKQRGPWTCISPHLCSKRGCEIPNIKRVLINNDYLSERPVCPACGSHNIWDKSGLAVFVRPKFERVEEYRVTDSDNITLSVEMTTREVRELKKLLENYLDWLPPTRKQSG